MFENHSIAQNAPPCSWITSRLYPLLMSNTFSLQMNSTQQASIIQTGRQQREEAGLRQPCVLLNAWGPPQAYNLLPVLLLHCMAPEAPAGSQPTTSERKLRYKIGQVCHKSLGLLINSVSYFWKMHVFNLASWFDEKTCQFDCVMSDFSSFLELYFSLYWEGNCVTYPALKKNKIY